MKVRCDYLRITGLSAIANITIQFENKDLQFRPRDSTNQAVVNLFGRITSMTRRPISTFEPRLEVNVPQEMMQSHYTQIYQQSVPLPAGQYRLNIVAKDTISGSVNVYEAQLNVPYFDDDKLSASSLILADTIEKLPAKQGGGTMFAIGDDKVRPRAGSSFSRSEKMGIYLQVYNFAPDAATQKPAGTVYYEIDVADSGERVLAVVQDVGSTANASPSQVALEKLLPLSTLAPGGYIVKVFATDARSNQTVQRQENFTVTAE
jgi:hypothetical protein